MTDSIAAQQAWEAFQEELDQATATIRSRFEDMRLSGLLDASGEQLKHMPGRHDQKRHDPTKGASDGYRGNKSPSDIPEIVKYNKIVQDRELRKPVFDDSWEVYDEVKPGVKAGKRSEGGFGLCAYHSMENCEDDPSLKVAVGVNMSEEDIRMQREHDKDRYWDVMFPGVTHVWNVDSAGRVVDSALGSKNARGDIYIGKIVPDDVLAGMKDDGELLSYAHSIVDASYPKSTMTEEQYTKMFDDWKDSEAHREAKQRSVKLKHLPGRHDQQRHDPHKGIAGTPVTVEWFNDGGSKYTRELPAELREIVEQSLITYNVDQEDLDGISRITTDPPRGHEYAGGGVYYDAKEGVVAFGAYDPVTSTLHISKAAMQHPASRASMILHELGHHVSEKSGDMEPKLANAKHAANRLQQATGGDPLVLAEYGLREYSLSSPYEFMADSYTVDKLGTEHQKENLRTYLHEEGIGDSIEAVYKQLGIKIPVQEIKAIRSGDLIEFIAVDTEVDPAVLVAVPWYYIVGDVIKHQPGRHDQQRHAGTRGRVGGWNVDYGSDRKAAEKGLADADLSETDILELHALEGFEVDVRLETSGMYDGVKAYATYKDKDGNEVGKSEKIYRKTDATLRDLGDEGEKGDRLAEIKLLVFDDVHMGKGLAAQLHTKEIALLQDKGYSSVKLQANVTIGRYAWARKGYNYTYPEDAEYASDNFKSWAQSKGITKAMVGGSWPQFKSAKEVADFDVPGFTIKGNKIQNKDVPKGMDLRAGKAFMLDKDEELGHGAWQGMLELGQ